MKKNYQRRICTTDENIQSIFDEIKYHPRSYFNPFKYTGKLISSFAHIREYRGTVNAYFWQSIALLFGNNLKAAYDPYGEDAEIEEIVQKIVKEFKN